MFFAGLAESPVMYGGMDYLGNSEYKVHWYHAHATNIHKFRLAYKQVKVSKASYWPTIGHLKLILACQ